MFTRYDPKLDRVWSLLEYREQTLGDTVRENCQLPLEVTLRDERIARFVDQLERVQADNARCIKNFQKVTSMFTEAAKKLEKYRLLCAKWKARALGKLM